MTFLQRMRGLLVARSGEAHTRVPTAMVHRGARIITNLGDTREISLGESALISHNANILDNDTPHPGARHRQFVTIIDGRHPTDILLNEHPVPLSRDVLVGARQLFSHVSGLEMVLLSARVASL